VSKSSLLVNNVTLSDFVTELVTAIDISCRVCLVNV
jgi:hypothetical protein